MCSFYAAAHYLLAQLIEISMHQLITWVTKQTAHADDSHEMLSLIFSEIKHESVVH